MLSTVYAAYTIDVVQAWYVTSMYRPSRPTSHKSWLRLVDRRKLVRLGPHRPQILTHWRPIPILTRLLRPHPRLVLRPDLLIPLTRQHGATQQTTRRPLHQDRKDHFARYEIRLELEYVGAVDVGHGVVDSGHDSL